MDKDQTEDQEKHDQEKHEQETVAEEVVEEALIEPVVQDPSEPTVVVKKSGGALSLLLSIVALGVAGYLFYQDWQGSDSTTTSASVLPEIQQLQQANQSLAAQLSQAKSETQQLKEQLTSLQQSLSEVRELAGQKSVQTSVFDNSENERLLQQLAQQLADQAQSTSALQRQITSLPTDAGMQQLSPEMLIQLQNAAAAQTLLTTQTLLDTGQVAAAGQGLDRYLQTANLGTNLGQRLQRLSERIQMINVPDAEPLRQELQALSLAVKGLELPTVETDDDSQWYDRFISVKKISDDSALNSSVQLMELKVQLDRLLYQAGLNLTMQQQEGWQSSLHQAANLLQQQLPQQALVKQLNDLASEQVRVVVPADLGIGALVNELKGTNP